jgi:hypothetical protein
MATPIHLRTAIPEAVADFRMALTARRNMDLSSHRRVETASLVCQATVLADAPRSAAITRVWRSSREPSGDDPLGTGNRLGLARGQPERARNSAPRFVAVVCDATRSRQGAVSTPNHRVPFLDCIKCFIDDFTYGAAVLKVY